MHTKISNEFWSHPEIEPTSYEVKLAALWLLSHSRIKMCGYAEVTEKRFAFETGLDGKAYERAFDALPKTFQKLDKGYLVPNYIRWQFGSGPALAKSYMSIPVVRELQSCPPAVVSMVLTLYPELSDRYDELSKKALQEGSGSPTQGQRVGVREGEGTGEGAAAKRTRVPKPAPPPQISEAVRARMNAVGECVRRRPDAKWNDQEMKAVTAAGLLTIDQADFDEQVGAMKRFYRATIPEAKKREFWRRSTLPILLNNWPSELDKARMWIREAGGDGPGVTRL